MADAHIEKKHHLATCICKSPRYWKHRDGESHTYMRIMLINISRCMNTHCHHFDVTLPFKRETGGIRFLHVLRWPFSSEHDGVVAWKLFLPCFITPYPSISKLVNTLRPRQDGRHFADDIFSGIFFNGNCCILIKFSLKYVRKGPIDNNRALVQIMAWRRSGDKPLSEPMMMSLSTHIYVTRPQRVKLHHRGKCGMGD